MSTSKTPWHHCRRCGTLFQSSPNTAEQRICPKCASFTHPSPTPAFSGKNPEYRVRIAKSHSKSTGRHASPIKLIAAALLVLGAIIIAIRILSPGSPPPVPAASPATSPATAAPTLLKTLEDQENALKNQELFEKARLPISLCLSGFLSTNIPEQGLKNIMATTDALTRITEFYQKKPSISASPGNIQYIGSSTLDLPNQHAIEFYWKTTSGVILDTTFFEEDGQWRLDFDHFAALSSNQWPLFLIGTGDESAEFRLLARLRHSEDDVSSPHITLVLHSPTFGKPIEVSGKSPDFIIPRDGKIGRHLAAAFAADKAGKRPFGVTLPKLESEEFIRVRVRVRRTQVGDEKTFTITELPACHWYNTDELGLEIPK